MCGDSRFSLRHASPLKLSSLSSAVARGSSEFPEGVCWASVRVSLESSSSSSSSTSSLRFLDLPFLALVLLLLLLLLPSTTTSSSSSSSLDGVEIRDIDARIMINFRRSDWINVVRSKGGHQLREPTDAPKKLGHMR